MNYIQKIYSKIMPASKNQAKKLMEELQESKKLIEELCVTNRESMLRCNELEKRIGQLNENLYKAEKHSYHAYLYAQESVWAHVWSDTTKDVQWLEGITFSPGRWAVGYQYLYVLYRVLTEVHPKSILELGLGQSTKLISRFAEQFQDVEHTVVEHDEEWIKFFINENPLGEHTNIEKMDLEMTHFLEDDCVINYKDFEKRFQGEKYNLVSIDAPFGGKAKKYARIDLLKILPMCLAESFIIMVDDYNRTGEKEMVKKLEEILTESGIKYKEGIYTGVKQTIVITSDDWSFLSTL